VDIPSSLLRALEQRSPSLVITADDVSNMEEEKIGALLFSVAVYLKSSPGEIRELIINGVNILPTLMNTYSVALQVCSYCYIP